MNFDYKTRMVFPNSDLGVEAETPWFPYLDNNWKSAEKREEIWDSIDQDVL